MARINILKKVKIDGVWKLLSIPRNPKGNYDWTALPDGVYFTEWYSAGRRRRESAGTTAAQALEAQRRKKYEIEGRKLGIPGYNSAPEPASALPVASAVAQYLEHVETLKKPNTYRKYQAVLWRFSKHFEGRAVEAIPIADLNDYIVHLKRDVGMSANTVLHNTIIIAQFFKRQGRGGITRLLDLPERIVTALSNENFTLFRNLGKGAFQDATYASGLALLSLPWAGWGVGMFDLNNDGLKDVFTANSHVMDNEELYSSRTFRQPNSVFANAGGARFLDARDGAGPATQSPRAHRGCAFGDFDNDGRIDVVVSCLNEPAELLRNASDRRQHWFELLLTGQRSNRDAIGSAVRLVSASGRTQYNHVTTAVGYASASSRRVHFGLGAESQIASVEIRWPSGTVQKLEHPEVDRCLRVTEPE